MDSRYCRATTTILPVLDGDAYRIRGRTRNGDIHLTVGILSNGKVIQLCAITNKLFALVAASRYVLVKSTVPCQRVCRASSAIYYSEHTTACERCIDVLEAFGGSCD